jgi:hypothetical protein
MNNKEFLKYYPLELSLPTTEAKALRKVIKKANESHVLDVREELGVKVGNLQYYNFYITCPMTTFASAYFNFGLLYCKHVLPIWKDRFARRAKKRVSKTDNKSQCDSKKKLVDFLIKKIDKKNICSLSDPYDRSQLQGINS